MRICQQNYYFAKNYYFVSWFRRTAQLENFSWTIFLPNYYFLQNSNFVTKDSNTMQVLLYYKRLFFEHEKICCFLKNFYLTDENLLLFGKIIHNLNYLILILINSQRTLESKIEMEILFKCKTFVSGIRDSLGSKKRHRIKLRSARG